MGLVEGGGLEELVLAAELVLNGAIVDELPVDDAEDHIEVRAISGLDQLHQPHLEHALLRARPALLRRPAPTALVALLEVEGGGEVVDAERVAEADALNGLVVVAAVPLGPLEEDVEGEVGEDGEEDLLVVPQVLPLLVLQHTL